MKKTLLAVVLLGAYAATASAQTSVTLYGQVDGGIAYENNGAPAGSVLRVENGGQTASRFGIRGVEDLGGGLSALFVLENGFLVGTGAMATTNVLFDRQSWVGLKGGYGTFRLGRQETLVYAAFNKGFDPFGRGLAGNIDRMFLIGGSGKRANNTLTYTSPTFGGFSGDLAYTFGQVAGDTSQSREIGLSAQYIKGPVGVIVAHHNANSAAPVINAKTNFVAGYYDFGPVKGYLAYGDNKNDSAVLATKIDTRNWLIGVSAPVGPHLFMVDFIRKADKAVANRDATQVAVGYTYTISKRTNFYTSFSRTNNDSAGTTNVITAGASDKLLNAGIRHTF